MRQTIISPIIAVQALFLAVGFVSAQTDGFDAITKPIKDEKVVAGTEYEITWDYDSAHPGTIFISLLEGATSTTLQEGPNITTGVESSAGSYLWDVDSTLGDDATYGLKISLESDPSIFQFSNPFHIDNAGGRGPGSASESGNTSATNHSHVILNNTLPLSGSIPKA